MVFLKHVVDTKSFHPTPTNTYKRTAEDNLHCRHLMGRMYTLKHIVNLICNVNTLYLLIGYL